MPRWRIISTLHQSRLENPHLYRQLVPLLAVRALNTPSISSSGFMRPETYRRFAWHWAPPPVGTSSASRSFKRDLSRCPCDSSNSPTCQTQQSMLNPRKPWHRCSCRRLNEPCATGEMGMYNCTLFLNILITAQSRPSGGKRLRPCSVSHPGRRSAQQGLHQLVLLREPRTPT